MIPGITVQMGGQDFVVPPLTLGQLRRLIPKVRQMTDVGAGMGEAEIGTLVELVTAALSRNYPEMTAEQVEDLLDLGNASNVLSVILTGSGLSSTGETQARTTETISPPSMASSLPAAATDTAT